MGKVWRFVQRGYACLSEKDLVGLGSIVRSVNSGSTASVLDSPRLKLIELQIGTVIFANNG